MEGLQRLLWLQVLCANVLLNRRVFLSAPMLKAVLGLQTEILQIPTRQEGSSFPPLSDVNPCFWAPKTRKFLFGRENLTAYIQTAENERFFVKAATL